MHLVGFIIRIYHDARSPERQLRLIKNVTSTGQEVRQVAQKSLYYATTQSKALTELLSETQWLYRFLQMFQYQFFLKIPQKRYVDLHLRS